MPTLHFLRKKKKKEESENPSGLNCYVKPPLELAEKRIYHRKSCSDICARQHLQYPERWEHLNVSFTGRMFFKGRILRVHLQLKVRECSDLHIYYFFNEFHK